MKKIIFIMVYALTILFFVADEKSDNADLENANRCCDYFKSRCSALNQKVWDLSLMNIIMNNYISDKDQRKLRKDPHYIEVLGKVN